MIVRNRLLSTTTGLLLVLCAMPARAGNDELKAAAAAVTEKLAETSFVAKIDLGSMQKFFVLPDGSPSDEKGRKQGSGGWTGSTVWMPGGKVKVHAGEVGRTIRVTSNYPGKSSKNRFYIHLNKKARQTLNPALVTVLLDRPVTPEDMTADRIALAVSSLATVEGYEPGAAMAAALDRVLDEAPREATPDGVAAPGPGRPTVLSLEVRAEPSRVGRGDDVRLVLEYGVGAPEGSVTATETRAISFDGNLMPTYPATDDVTRSAGTHTSVQVQPLPAAAAAGVYTFEGQVCVGGDCIQRSTTFEVSAD